MKKIVVAMVCFMMVASSANAGWFSKKKTAKPAPASAIATEDQTKSVAEPAVRLFNARKIGNIYLGMTRAQVEETLGDSVRVGYRDIRDSGARQEILMKNPYRAETLRGLGEAYEVLFYVTDIKNPDGAITDDELTPVVFNDGLLAGKDWKFYDQLKTRLQGQG